MSMRKQTTFEKHGRRYPVTIPSTIGYACNITNKPVKHKWGCKGVGPFTSGIAKALGSSHKWDCKATGQFANGIANILGSSQVGLQR